MQTYSNSYCAFCLSQPINAVNRVYHDHEYGFPINSDNELFARLVLEINQAGLSWSTILNKKNNFYSAYDDFEITTIANYSIKDRTRLLQDAGIVRNKLKVDAVIHNANVVKDIQDTYGSFAIWLEVNHPKSKEEWIKLFKSTFKFTGGEITNEFLMSIGYLKGAHGDDCPIFEKILKLNPRWNQV